MRHIMTVLTVVLLAASANVMSQQPQAGSIEGVVVRAGTGEPVTGAQVTLTSFNVPPGLAGAGVPGGVLGGIVATGIGGGVAGGGGGGGVIQQSNVTVAPPPGGAPVGAAVAPPQAFPVQTTGSDGKFAFKNLRAGNYRVAAVANGYVRQEYAQRAMNTPGRPIALGDNEAFKDATISLTPAGTLSGRIYDEAGQPATGAPVQLLRPVYNIQGRNFQTVGNGFVDDRGDYRIFNVPPGRYYLNAGTAPGPGGLRGGPVGAARYEMIFYPNVRNIDQAATIEVPSGSETSVNMTVKRQLQSYRVSGRVIDSATGAPPPAVQIMMAYRGVAGGSGAFSSGNPYDPSTGTFQIQNVSPGDYTVQATVRPQAAAGQALPIDPAGIEARRVAQASLPSAAAPIRVIDADIEGVVLTLRSGVTLEGRIIVEGQSITSVTGLDRMRITMNPPVQIVNQTPPVAMAPSADGLFQMVGAREGEYRVTAAGMPQGFYVKSIHYDGDDILTRPFRFSGLAGGTVNVVLRPGAVQLSGTVTDSELRPVPSTQVMLVPAERGRNDLYRQALTDQSGRFSFPNVPPGPYRVFGWDGIEPGAQFNPEFMQQYEQRGQSVQLAESANQDVNVRLISLP